MYLEGPKVINKEMDRSTKSNFSNVIVSGVENYICKLYYNMKCSAMLNIKYGFGFGSTPGLLS